ncbi:MAG: response regulator transcription factor [Pedobacter sp.]|nr:MAG: response regulator transcription factor [Pedobacter sp.]
MINRILIIEDEKLNADRLVRLIGNIVPQVEILAILDSVLDAVEWFKDNPSPTLVFMDIRLSDGLSFEIFESVEISCPIIFTTAYDEYAVKAFKYNSVDYLLKPVEQDELRAAMNKVEQYSEFTYSRDTITKLLGSMQPKTFRTRFLLPYRDGYRTILVGEICYFYLEAKIIMARLANGTEVAVPQSMEELEQQLDPKYFFRANRQSIIHIDSVSNIHNYFNGKLKLTLRDSEMEVVVSREKSAAMKAWMDY